MRKIWDIPGGVHPPENKHQSNQSPIGKVDLPAEIILPVSQHIGAPADPIVNVGDKVLKGQMVAAPHGFVSLPIHASTSGTVTAIEDRFISHSSGMKDLCIVIEPDGLEAWVEVEPCADYKSLERATIIEKIRNAGIAGMGGAGFPSSIKLSPRADHKIGTLILNGTECEPYITADDVLMRERAEQIVEGALLLSHLLLNPKEVLIGIEDNKPEAIAAMTKATENTPIEVVSFPTKYPSGGEKQLIQILTGKEVPNGGLPSELGIVVQNLGTAVAAYRAVRFGEPLISRVTTVVGESLKEQRNIDVLIGTPIEHILRAHGFEQEKNARLIIGGPMMGYAVEQTRIPVVKTTNCILAPSKQEMPQQPPAQPCIRCGMCAEACPANLLPQQLFWFSQAEEFEKLETHNLYDCIECGACSFVCPSNIPLVQYYRHSKGTMRQLEKEKQKSDRSRQRFEFRQERIAKTEAEKEAKRLARKKAAEEAKKKMAEASSDGASKDKAAEAIAAASAKAKQVASTVDPEKQKAKLTRGLSSAENRLERAQQQLNEGKLQGDPARIETLEARLKQAELKVSEAKSKLEEFEHNGEAVSSAGENAKQKIAQSPIEIHQKAVESTQKRLDVAKTKFAEAQNDNAPAVDALRQGVEKLEAKLKDAKQALAEVESSSATPTDTEVEKSLSAAELAIEKAKQKAAAKANMSDEEKLADQVNSLEGRLEKAQTKLQKAIEEGNDNVDAFRLGVEKLEAKLNDAKTALGKVEPRGDENKSAADLAIEKAQQKATAQAAMSDEEKREAQKASLESRLDKAKTRLQKAIDEDNENVDAFRTGVEKLEQKLAEFNE